MFHGHPSCRNLGIRPGKSTHEGIFAIHLGQAYLTGTNAIEIISADFSFLPLTVF
jgi:hypothetical protein